MLAAVIAGASLAPLAPASAAQPQKIELGSDAFVHTAHWEVVSGRADGRFHGSSLRTFRPGERATLEFAGTAVRLYGVVGRGGGLGVVSLDGYVAYVVNFYAPNKATHREVYASPPLKPGKHRLTVDVVQPHDRTAKAHYVNLDGAEVSP